jgi:uncharacterized membrane protein YqjE
MSDQVDHRLHQPDKSLGDLVGDLTEELSHLLEDHMELAKRELRSEARQAARSGGAFGAAAVAGLLALITLSLAVGWALAEVMAPGWAFLIVGGAWAVVAIALALAGKQRLQQFDPAPRQTIDELKEDQEWLTTKR